MAEVLLEHVHRVDAADQAGDVLAQRSKCRASAAVQTLAATKRPLWLSPPPRLFMPMTPMPRLFASGTTWRGNCDSDNRRR